MPSAHADISRRRVLLSAAALALLSTTAAACGTSTPQPEVDGLTAQLDRARADAALATAAAAAQPGRAPANRALNAVAADRNAHAEALVNELTRMGAAPLSTATSTSTATPTPDSGTHPGSPGVDDVVGALKESAERAGRLAATLSGYRAGLLGSIAASCTAAYTVALGGAQ
ncbi:hypothetical protein FR943_12125 [Mycobacterium sp. TNTM28]|uniref:Tat pathway signal protein n=1 Tax=[Mycobacterium] fortunisiensis TaxID=2600579 RepID=A0ABS6KLY8_9MYCO|nr:hypothetical protein [[Mycobacterium] fortunisiensis]MBU9764591.1 hypothetical protein [[Mycobacterium] fortunisiensis]